MNYAYRGEDQAKGGKPGRTPDAVKQAGGFKPWKIATLEEAQTELKRLAENGSLEDEARKWCLTKNRENGWFFSTGISQAVAYDNYDFLYRMNISRLAQRSWIGAGLGAAKNVDKMVLYTDAAQISASTQIAVIWQFPNRKEELLVMSPFSVAHIELQKSKGTFISLAQWT